MKHFILIAGACLALLAGCINISITLPPGASIPPSALPSPSAPDISPSPTVGPPATLIPENSLALVRIEQTGGFVPQEWTFTHYPNVVLYADGRLIEQGAVPEIYPGPALPANLVEARISQAGIDQIMSWAKDAGLLGADHMLGQPVPDAGVTQFIVVSPDGVHHSTSLAPSFGDTSSADPAISAVLDFQTKMLGLPDLLPGDVISASGPYHFDRLRIISSPVITGMETPSDLTSTADWPLTSLASLGQQLSFGNYRCAVFTGADLNMLVAALGQANELTQWQSEGVLYALVAHPLLPDDTDCPATDI